MTERSSLFAGVRIRHSRHRRAGFALVATLLLSFLVISLLVALLSIVLVESRVVTNQMKLSRARAYAMNGAYAALSRLHDYNGLDWRATATAGMLDSDPTTPELEGIENPWLAGVWTGRGKTSAEQHDKPILWLTSGAKSYPTRAPELQATQDSSTSDEKAVTPMTKLPDPGPGTDTVWLLRKPVGSDPKLSVKARKQEFVTHRPFRSADPKQPYVIGHYAWWAADEGVKARVNLPLPENDPAQPSPKDDAQTIAQWRLAAPQRGMSLMDGFDSMPKDQKNLHKVLTFAQIPLLAGGSGSSLNTALQKRWHDVTADSNSLITNSRDGGVKLDLSMLMEMTEEDRRQFGGEIFAEGLIDYYQTWKRVRNRTTAPALDAQPFAIKPADDSKQALAIAANTWLNKASSGENSLVQKCLFSPVVIRMSHAFSVQAQSAAPREIDGPDRKLVLVLDPLVTLWNPYNVILELDAFRIDAWLPSVHLVVEKRDPWKQQKLYQAGDEVWHNAQLYRASQPTIGFEPGNEPNADTPPKWEPLARDWSLASDIQPAEMLLNYSSDSRPRLLLLKNKTNPQTRLSLRPGEIVTFSLNSGQVTPHERGSVHLTLEPGWNASGGISFDRLADDRHPLRTPDQLLRLHAGSEVRITLDPARDSGYAGADPFGFVANYANDRLATQDNITPQAWRESIGYRNGGGGDLDDYAWAGVRTGRGPEFSHRIRFYSGEEGGKPLPGMSGTLKLGTDITDSSKTFLGVIDWRMKSEADVSGFPAASPALFDPRCVIVRHPGAGYPATLPQYQVKARRIFSGDEIPGNEPPLVTGGKNFVALFEVPTAPLLSMGQLQHFPVQCEAPSLIGMPGHIIGNSWASPWTPRTSINANGRMDVCYQLFDQFFFSSITPRPEEDTVNGRLADFLDSKLAKPLPNPRIKFLLDYGDRRKDLLTALTRPLDEKNNPVAPYRRVAANLVIEGGFNVNSTSVEAWKAVLGSLSSVKIPTFDAEGLSISMAASTSNPLPRFTLVNGDSNAATTWRGYRSLSTQEVESLATEIVREVKTRGPFVSLSDFINRRLVDDDTGKKGALQAAIDRTGINKQFTAQVTRQQLDNATALGTAAGMDWSFPYPDHMTLPIAAGSPGYLTQADILQALAPHLVTRSDTYKIRSYGDVVNPVTGRLEARAWVEVIVQRTPDYVNYPNKDEPPEERQLDPNWLPTHSLHNVSNRVYGRRWRVVRVRWLSAEEV